MGRGLLANCNDRHQPWRRRPAHQKTNCGSSRLTVAAECNALAASDNLRVVSSSLLKDAVSRGIALRHVERNIGSLSIRSNVPFIKNGHGCFPSRPKYAWEYSETELDEVTITNYTAALKANCYYLSTTLQPRVCSYLHPYASLINHSCDYNHILGTDGEELYAKAMRPIKKGGQIFTSYIHTTHLTSCAKN
ncbi:hypothetical protein N7535_004703 [Penicillium sp. DV-2018c]|nr:hypothetical protein N7535_004703 [Penicillium sp. DV-2018c]